jgi:hypothetical protein
MSDPVKILFLLANPTDITRIRIDEEVREVDKKIQLGSKRDRLQLLSQLAVRPSDLAQALLRHTPHILHFSGHGSATEGIVLEDDSGKTKPVATKALAKLLGLIEENLSVVVLNACFSAVQAEAIQQVVNFTIVMKTKISDRAAIAFSAAFYQALAFGCSVGKAFDMATAELDVCGIPESDTPELLVRTGKDATAAFLIKEDEVRNEEEKVSHQIPEVIQVVEGAKIDVSDRMDMVGTEGSTTGGSENVKQTVKNGSIKADSFTMTGRKN